MSTATVMAANHAILERIVPEVQIEDFAPPVLHEPLHLYQQMAGSVPVPFASSGCNRIRHSIGLRLLVLMTADGYEAEHIVWDLNDRIGAEYAANRTLDQTVLTAELAAEDAEPYVVLGDGSNTQYRQLRWRLTAEEQIAVTYR